MPGKVALVLLLFDLDGSHIQALQQVPFLRAGAFLEEVEQDHIVELQALSLVDGQAKGVLEHGWDLGFALLIPHDDDLVAAELQRRLLKAVLTLNFLFFPSAQHIKEELLVRRSEDHGFGSFEIRNLLLEAIDGLREEYFEGGDN